MEAVSLEDFLVAVSSLLTKVQEEEKDVDTQQLYDVLGVPKEATEQEIKKAFRKATLQHHPDKGGDENTFKELNGAYEVLGNAEKR